MRGPSGRERSGANMIKTGQEERTIAGTPKERERQGLNGRGTVSEREGELASWRRGKPGTNGIRSAYESEG